ncbi:KilA-N domain-containing protein [Halomonas sp. McH1-25]|uniref:KilA-N domain-containing protein n=1 Tax=unclassified Halomonas TaxID=2609666 RepID=UPI001EF423A8|nr:MULTISPECIES: KilA-N domain-containing protein [unclassified Halomonas]MCG7598867.1 KilA-N domain-containing protein [Halomonas sp. McH1-25]MCP1340830.1 KilA-N domain-containing protein [Halomonas sp. FL8]MCP1361287.1 KilA-N domain-containing protein [Halomonas sp. BBD45]MCP1363686.1 KilA-N domain-containing protein [Halomonas sp. BBD48]
MQNVVPFPYQGQTVRFNTDGWINATEIAKRYGKRLDRWLRTDETQEYIAALARHLNTPEKGDLIRTQRGRGGGTWLHPKLGVAFTRWIDVDFGVWADMQIDALLRGEVGVRQRYEEACQALDDQNERGSMAGRELASHRWSKPPLEARVEYWRDQLQMTLALDVA